MNKSPKTPSPRFESLRAGRTTTFPSTTRQAARSKPPISSSLKKRSSPKPSRGRSSASPIRARSACARKTLSYSGRKRTGAGSSPLAMSAPSTSNSSRP